MVVCTGSLLHPHPFRCCTCGTSASRTGPFPEGLRVCWWSISCATFTELTELSRGRSSAGPRDPAAERGNVETGPQRSPVQTVLGASPLGLDPVNESGFDNSHFITSLNVTPTWNAMDMSALNICFQSERPNLDPSTTVPPELEPPLGMAGGGAVLASGSARPTWRPRACWVLVLDMGPDVREQDVPAVSMDGCTRSAIISGSDADGSVINL